MPIWLQKQIRKAFIKKDKNQIHVLNQCWYYYQKIQ